MSFCTKINNNAFQAFTNTKTDVVLIISKIGQFTSSFFQRALKIGNSFIGKKSLLAARENVVEYIAYYKGAEIAAPYGKSAGNLVGRLAGKVLVAGSAYSVSKNLTHFISNKTAHLNRLLQQLICAGTFLGTSYLILSICSEPMNYLAPLTGEVVGEYAAYFTTGIACAFFSIKLLGSEEVFFHSSNIMSTYPAKTIVSMAGTALVSHYFPIPESIQPLSDLIVGSLIYNSLELFELGQKIHDGKLLDKIFPKTLPDPGCFEACLRKTSYQIVNITTEHLLSQLQNTLANDPTLKFTLINKFLRDLTPSFQDYLKTLCDSHLDPNSPIFEGLRNLTAEKASDMLVRGANLYFSTFKESPLNDLLLALPKFISSENIDLVNDRFFNHLIALEKKLCGFTLSRENEQANFRNFLENHLENIVKCAILCSPLSITPLEDHEARLFYSNLIDIATDHYTPIFGQTISKGIGLFLKHQVHHSELQK